METVVIGYSFWSWFYQNNGKKTKQLRLSNRDDDKSILLKLIEQIGMSWLPILKVQLDQMERIKAPTEKTL
jgi:hypothetical protein